MIAPQVLVRPFQQGSVCKVGCTRVAAACMTLTVFRPIYRPSSTVETRPNVGEHLINLRIHKLHKKLVSSTLYRAVAAQSWTHDPPKRTAFGLANASWFSTVMIPSAHKVMGDSWSCVRVSLGFHVRVCSAPSSATACPKRHIPSKLSFTLKPHVRPSSCVGRPINRALDRPMRDAHVCI